jgi:hypothetical protein
MALVGEHQAVRIQDHLLDGFHLSRGRILDFFAFLVAEDTGRRLGPGRCRAQGDGDAERDRGQGKIGLEVRSGGHRNAPDEEKPQASETRAALE